NKQAHELTSHFDKWVYFLKHLEDFDQIPAILNEPIFQKGFEIAELAHLNSEQYEHYLKSVLEHNEAKASLDTAFSQGKLAGKIEGKLEAMHSAAKVLKSQGIAVSVIALSTGLTEHDIENLS
ncbi:MAG: Rpn family recombination-promoting nuclease/putative transposase, partial [Methylovulum sp.]|nr:Rpn family recombination-promoting nuclease/putative transposase [Methylovulum sp.]